MENCGIKINVVTFIFMFSLPVKLQKSIKTQRNDSFQFYKFYKSLLKEMFYSQNTK